jgi:hypothetical protein
MNVNAVFSAGWDIRKFAVEIPRRSFIFSYIQRFTRSRRRETSIPCLLDIKAVTSA